MLHKAHNKLGLFLEDPRVGIFAQTSAPVPRTKPFKTWSRVRRVTEETVPITRLKAPAKKRTVVRAAWKKEAVDETAGKKAVEVVGDRKRRKRFCRRRKERKRNRVRGLG